MQADKSQEGNVSFALSEGAYSESRRRMYKPSDSHRWKVVFCPSRCTAWKNVRANPQAAALLSDPEDFRLTEMTGMASASGVI